MNTTRPGERGIIRSIIAEAAAERIDEAAAARIATLAEYESTHATYIAAVAEDDRIKKAAHEFITDHITFVSY
tara:strand:- start:435 stop:653 length:219 start_codon:yes stop_codon:yes gene_type:complete